MRKYGNQKVRGVQNMLDEIGLHIPVLTILALQSKTKCSRRFTVYCFKNFFSFLTFINILYLKGQNHRLRNAGTKILRFTE